MAYLGNALQQLRDERRRAQLQIEKMDSAISVLEGLIGRNSTTPLRRRIRRGRTVSAAARRSMAAAQRRAREQGQARRTAGKKVSATPKRRKLSAAGHKRMAAAAKARWARFRAKAKKAH